jgi:D-alanyl-D-alanine carboxypeptidase
MTATARALGMSHTHYNNASGLPDAGQLTTVRDQAILAMAVYEHFPKYYAYFQTKAFRWGKRTYGNHNRLLGSNGIDGIKSGYINASGYNLMTAAREDGHHIVVIGFGFNSGGSRDAKVRELVRKYLPKSRTGEYVAEVPMPGRKGAPTQIASPPVVPVLPAPAPDFRDGPQVEVASLSATDPAPVLPAVPPVLTGEAVVASVQAPIPAIRPAGLGLAPALAAVNALGNPTAAAPTPKGRPGDVVGAWTGDNMALGAAPAPLGQTRPSAPILPPVNIGDDQPIDLLTSGGIKANEQQVAAADAAQPMPPDGWIVQIGAAPTEAGASGLLSDAAARIGALVDFRSYVERFEKNGQVFFRARFAGFGGRDAATDMCNALKKATMSCLAMQG